MRDYVAVVHKEADSDFGVSFPHFPGCVSAGATFAEAAAMAAEASNGHAGLMADEGETNPEPSTLDLVMSDPDIRDEMPAGIALV